MWTNEAIINRLIDEEQARFAEEHPKSAAAWAKGRRSFLYGGPSHWMRRWAGGFPLYVASAEGARVTDIDGHVYADFCLGDTGGMCGHGVEAVTEAALAQLRKGAATMLPTEDSLWVGAELARRFGLTYWTLTTSATDANRAAIRIARMITGRAKVLVFSGCYHGGVEEAHVELVDGQMRLRNAIHPNGVDHARVSKVVEFNDVDALEAALAGDVACVLTEPVMTNYGMIPPAPGFHAALQAAAKRAGALLIMDETHTLSCGPGGYTRLEGLKPDMLVLGKAIAGGVPCGALGCSEDVAQLLWDIAPAQNPRHRQSAHMGMGGTLAGSPLSVATMKAVLSSVLTEENFERMIASAARLANDASAVIAERGLPWHVTQIGARVELMFAPVPPRNGAEARNMRTGGLETLLHVFHLNERILVTPFHTMFLMSPATREDDVERHRLAFNRFCDRLADSEALAPGAAS